MIVSSHISGITGDSIVMEGDLHTTMKGVNYPPGWILGYVVREVRNGRPGQYRRADSGEKFTIRQFRRRRQA